MANGFSGIRPQSAAEHENRTPVSRPSSEAPIAGRNNSEDRVQSTNSEPVTVKRVNSEPVNSKPITLKRVNSEPVNSEPANSEPVNSAQVNSEPVNSEPVNSKPVNSEPVNSKPVNPEPVNTEQRAKLKGSDDAAQTNKAKSTESSAKPNKSPLKSARDEPDLCVLPIENNPLYNVTTIIDRLSEYPVLKIRREGKYYLSMKRTVVETHPKVKRTKRGKVIPTIFKETLGPIESIFSRFCEEVLSITRANVLPLSSQGERHLIWVSRIKAKHIIKLLNGNGCYIVNRFPGDVFLKDKQVMGVTLRQYMLERKNACFWKCGAPSEGYVDEEDEVSDQSDITYRICQHMVQSMRTDNEGCDDSQCHGFEKRLCKHFDVFIPEVQSFSSYNALQDFSNRLNNDLKGQLFICKPAYLYKGLGFRFFSRGPEFEEFYHMTIGKETSRHDFLVQRVVSDPYLFNGRKVDIRAFLLIVTLRYRRVVAFVNPGFCRVSSIPYESPGADSEEDSSEREEPLTAKEQRRKREEKMQQQMRMIVCTHQTELERAERAKRMEQRQLFTDDEDRSKTLNQVFENDEALLTKIKKQIKHIGQRLAEGIERRVWDAYGCYQIFSLDLCVNTNGKVWLLEVNSHAMSEVDLLSPTQRLYVPAVMMEALGLVAECMYKSSRNLRLRKSPYDEFKETGFLFGQNFQMAFSTLTRRRTNYRHPRPRPDNGPPFYERIAMVDNLLRRAARYKRALSDLKQKHHDEKMRLKSKREEKKEEES